MEGCFPGAADKHRTWSFVKFSICGFVWKQGTSKSLDSLSSLYNIHPYVQICIYIYVWFSIYVCIGVIASSLHQKHAIWQQATRQSSSLLIYSKKICFNESFYGCPAWSNTSIWLSYHIGSIQVYPTGYIYINYIYISLYPSISHWYPSDIPDLHAGTCSSAQGHQLWSRLFLWSRAQLVSDSNLDTKRTDSLKGFKRISHKSMVYQQEIQENIVTWLYKLKLYMSRCIR